MSANKTDRRSFLKAGALVAAPVAALAPAAALAREAGAERLARLEDERAIEALMRAFLRHFNGTEGADQCGEFVASSGAIRIAPEVAAIEPDPVAEVQLTLAPDGRTARWQSVARVRIDSRFAGNSTLEKMARFQGPGAASASASRRIEAEFAKGADGWTITRLALA